MKPIHPTTLVAIVGGSGSGKSWLAKRLLRDLGQPALSFSLDDFYRDQSGLSPEVRESINFDHPAAIEWNLFEDTLRICSGQTPFSLPQYDFKHHCRGKKQIQCDPASIAIIDGLWLLHHPDVRGMFDLTFYLECPEELRMQRRIARDVAERGRTARDSRLSFLQTVNAMHDIHVAPQKFQAQHIINCPFGEPEIALLRESILDASAGRSSENSIHLNLSNYDYAIN